MKSSQLATLLYNKEKRYKKLLKENEELKLEIENLKNMLTQ